MAAKAKVIPIRSKKKDLVEVDFTEIDKIRTAVKELVEKYRVLKISGHYDRSYFYIGRGVTNLVFRQLYCNRYRMQDLVKDLVLVYDFNHAFYVNGRDLYVYLRGKRKE
jgi:hypothetical protein